MEYHPFEKRALDHAFQHRLFDRENHILAAVSGGPDSVALIHLLTSLRRALDLARITVIHFNHQLRGTSSEEDESFVASLAESLELPFYSSTGDVRTCQVKHRISLEMAARACRHRFFLDARTRFGARSIALGHTADDQAEELLLRLVRGTGPSGMAGMKAKTQQGIVRPLLFASRKDVVDYLRDKDAPFREDASNFDPFCQRNALRLKVFPVLRDHFHENVVQTLCRHAQLVQDEERYWAGVVQSHWDALCIEEAPHRVALKCLELLRLPSALQKRILRFAAERLSGNLLSLYAVHVEGLRRWMGRAASGKAFRVHPDLWAAREGETLLLSSNPPFQSESFCWLVEKPGQYTFPSMHVSLRIMENVVYREERLAMDFPEMARFDAQQIRWPLVIRSWRPGDRFRPFGLRGTKKLQDFFTDLKIPKSERTRIPLLCDAEKICWVAGYRVDERVRVTAETRQVLIAEIRKMD